MKTRGKFGGLTALFLAVCLLAGGAGDVLGLSDDFEDGETAPIWQVIEQDSAVVSVEETDGRLELHAAASSDGEVAGYGSSGWVLDVGEDFKFRVDWHFAVTHGDESRVAVGLILPDFSNSIRFEAGFAYDDAAGGQISYSGVFDISGLIADRVERAADSGTVYVTYVAATDTLYVSLNGYYPAIPDEHDPAAGNWRYSGIVKDSWGVSGVQVYLGGAAQATELTGDASYLDEFVVDTGNVVWCGDMLVWGVTLAEQIYCRTAATFGSPEGIGWERVWGALSRVSAGPSGVWGVTKDDAVYYRGGVCPGNVAGDAWERVDGILDQIAAGPTGVVWGLTEEGAVYCRTGVSGGDPKGTGWQRVPGWLAQVSVGSDCAWGVAANKRVYYRSGVTPSNPAGTAWERVQGLLDAVSVGPTGVVWGLAGNDIYCRKGVSAGNPTGTGWQRVPGILKELSVGPNCAWGVALDDTVYFRSGVTPSNPTGNSWRRLGGRLVQLSAQTMGVEDD